MDDRTFGLWACESSFGFRRQGKAFEQRRVGINQENRNIQGLTPMLIQHSVLFTLKHPPGSDEESDFLEATKTLTDIPEVRNFRCLRQVSKKNPFSFGLSMEFDSEAAYEAYNKHPIHTAFVESRWIPEVAEFLEIDYAPYTNADPV